MTCWCTWSLTSAAFSIQFLDQNCFPQNDPGKLPPSVEKNKMQLASISICVIRVGKESQIQNSGTWASLYNDLTHRWFGKPLPARWEFWYNVWHVEIALMAIWFSWSYVEGMCWVICKREVLSIQFWPFNKKLNSKALTTAAGYEKNENCRTVSLWQNWTLTFPVEPNQRSL